jgi:hypothetical protein
MEREEGLRRGVNGLRSGKKGYKMGGKMEGKESPWRGWNGKKGFVWGGGGEVGSGGE